MIQKALSSAALAALLLAGCGEKEVKIEDIPYDTVAKAAAAGPEALKAHAGKAVQWAGTVITVQKVFGDDFEEFNYLLVDMDGKADGPGTEEISTVVPISRSKEFATGDRILLTAVIYEATKGPNGPVLNMKFKDAKPE